VFRAMLIAAVAVLPIFGLSAQDYVSDTLLRQGLSELRNGRYEYAAAVFRTVLRDESLSPFHGDALYWLAKTDTASENYAEAADAADRFLVFYPADSRRDEILYLRGRILHLEGESEKAVIALGDFIDENGESEFVPSAYYWIGESLIALGRLEEADAVLEQLLSAYPTSVKREAARFRRSEIALLYRERELLDLLKWSHEEYLQDAEEFYRRENEYRDAIASYREQLGDGTREDLLRLYRDRILDAKEQVIRLRRSYIDDLLEMTNAR